MVWNYWRRVFAHTWRRSVRTIGFESRIRVVTAALTAVIAAAALLFWGSQDAVGDFALERGVLWATAVLIFPIVYFWHLFRAPAEIDHENQQNISRIADANTKLAKQLVKQRADKQNVLALSVLLEDGYAITGDRTSAETYSSWAQKVRRWELLTLKFLAHHFSHPEAVSFSNVQYETKQNFIFNISPEHNKELQQTTARLQILRDIVAKREDDWLPLSQEDRSKIRALLEDFEAQVLAANDEQALD